jgi:hypothetical protein
MLKFGPYFTPTGLKPEIAIIIPVISAMSERFHKDVILSSGIDRQHSAKSLHYVGLALDIYWDQFDSGTEESVGYQFAMQLAERLGPLYDVVIHKDHIHVEYQPKKPVNMHWRTN